MICLVFPKLLNKILMYYPFIAYNMWGGWLRTMKKECAQIKLSSASGNFSHDSLRITRDSCSEIQQARRLKTLFFGGEQFRIRASSFSFTFISIMATWSGSLKTYHFLFFPNISRCTFSWKPWRVACSLPPCHQFFMQVVQSHNSEQPYRWFHGLSMLYYDAIIIRLINFRKRSKNDFERVWA